MYNTVQYCTTVQTELFGASIHPVSRVILINVKLLLTQTMLSRSLPTRIVTRHGAASTPAALFARAFSSSPANLRLSLAYDYHEPAKADSPGAPIVFMHGLFGSKKNNRSMSK